MGTLTGMMNLARSAVSAEQTALNTTSKNVANQTTAGYTREVTSFTETDAVTLNRSGFVGTGVSANTSSQRDLVLESSLHLATQTASAASSRSDALAQLESLFGLSATDTNASSTAIGSALDGLNSSLTALSANPSDEATRQAVVSAAQTLTSAFNTTANGLQQQTSNLNSEIATAAGQVDALTQTVASLNGQIAALGSQGDAGELEDQRQQAVQQLSSILGVNQITSDGTELTLTTTSGAVLVDGSRSYSLGTTTIDGKTQITAGDPSSVQSGLAGGTIGGLLEVRDQDLPAVSNALDQLAYSVGTAFNAANGIGQTSTGSVGGAIFALSPGTTGAAASITVAITSGDGLATAAAGEGSSGTGNLSLLTAAGTAANVSGQTASGFFASLVGAVGDTVSSASVTSTAASAAQTQAQTTRDSLSGVSLDDEAASLMTFQRAYQAAAKVMTVVDQLMESAINMGTDTAV